MALTILERPESHILDSTVHTGYTSESYGSGDASFVSISHGLTTGDFIFVVSVVEDYSGFFYVDVTNTNIFKLKRYSAGDYVQYISDAEIEWYSSDNTQSWSCVHLPITYRISNNLYPVNSSDTSRNITSTADVNGWTVINLSGSLGTIHSYDFIKLTLPNDTDLSGVYQIVEWVSATVMIINLAYDSGNNFTSATAIKHYNNYNVLVRVYVGLNSSHDYAAQKPYELAATLELTPDENNEVFFSINEILKAYIETRNNLLLGTLPYNMDFHTQFYIETAESYDDSDGYTFGTFTGSFTSDQENFEGNAANAKLEFKNQYSGYLNEYLMLTNNQGKFLTLFLIPVLFACTDDYPNCYQDISFIVPAGYPDVSIVKQYYYATDLQTTETEDVPNTSGGGVFRTQIEDGECAFDRVDLQVISNDVSVSTQFTGATQEATGSVDWVLDATLFLGGAQVTLTSAQSSERIGFPYSFKAGRTYNITQSFFRQSIGGSGDETITVSLYETISFGSFSNQVASHSFIYSASESIEFTPDEDADYIVFNISRIAGAGTYVYLPISTVIEGEELSAVKRFDINCDCSGQELRMTWLNNLGGFDYWNFTAQKDHIIEIQQALTTKKNIFPQWPISYGSTADTIRKQTRRDSNKGYTVRAQHLTEDQADAIAYIKSSVLVQIINSRQDRRTVTLDTDSFVKYQDQDKLFTIAFNLSFTDDIPSQTL